MSDFRRVTDSFSVSPQVTEADMAKAAAEGFVLVINNRPDGEDPGQPSSAAMEAAARAAGLDYLYAPVRGGPTPDQVEAVRAAVEAAGGPVLAFCRSGTRSIVTWSIGQAAAGEDRETLVNQGLQAGYDLSGVLPR
ncbi:TIGR01244 family sulfur transferase [Caulobacter segnis]